MEEEKKKTKTVAVFGVFDGLDAGHIFFLKKAREYGDELTVIVAPDSQVGTLKKKTPSTPLLDRIQALKDSGLVDEVIKGDEMPGSWEVLEKLHPDIIALGHDQDMLAEALLEHLKDSENPSLVHIPKM